MEHVGTPVSYMRHIISKHCTSGSVMHLKFHLTCSLKQILPVTSHANIQASVAYSYNTVTVITQIIFTTYNLHAYYIC